MRRCSMYSGKKISCAFPPAHVARFCDGFRCDFTCNDAVGCLKPRANRGLECLAPLLSEGIDLTLASLHDFATRAEITARLELIQHWVNRALCRTAASIRCFLNC